MRSSTRACIILAEDTNSSDEMEDVIRADLPHAHEDPVLVLHDLIKWHILNGPCHRVWHPQPKCTVMKDVVCTKRYPRNLHNKTQTEIGYPLYRRSLEDGGVRVL